ncbi:MAG: hypothetical protein UX77_C0002G0024 [Parcubacteria group bacterium GW2011_GWA1_47_11]|nr:MAG: hypothetical protein UX77_C0002G0024 [Parcubacteria group bacterium GW2011_GWA1_47_11]
MEIVEHKEIGDGAWDAFCDASPEAWARHRSMTRKGTLVYDKRSEDHSFGVMHDGALVAVAPLITQPLLDSGGGLEFAFSINTRPSDTHGLATPAPALIDTLRDPERQALHALCMDEIDKRARRLGVARTRMFVDPLTGAVPGNTPAENPLTAFGYADTSTTTYHIDLRCDEKVLLSRMSKGHRSDITFALRQNYEVDFFDRDTITQEAWQAFIDINDAAAGRVVYNAERWSETLERLRGGFCLLALMRPGGDGGHVSGALVTTYKRRAYYSVSAIGPRHRGLRGAGQLIQWRVMQELKRRGFECYDMGWQTGSSDKEAAIASFKRHFGGTPTPLWYGVKKY